MGLHSSDPCCLRVNCTLSQKSKTERTERRILHIYYEAASLVSRKDLGNVSLRKS